MQGETKTVSPVGMLWRATTMGYYLASMSGLQEREIQMDSPHPDGMSSNVPLTLLLTLIRPIVPNGGGTCHVPSRGCARADQHVRRITRSSAEPTATRMAMIKTGTALVWDRRWGLRGSWKRNMDGYGRALGQWGNGTLGQTSRHYLTRPSPTMGLRRHPHSPAQ